MSLDLKSNLHQINLSLVKPYRCSIYEFGNFRLDAEYLMLYRDGEVVPLTPKQVETLLALVERNGAIVSKDDLMSRLWGNSAVEESNLIQNIYVLRKALGTTAENKPFIETLRRRGYRFCGDLKRIPDGVQTGNGTVELSDRSARRIELLTTESGAQYLVTDEDDVTQEKNLSERGLRITPILLATFVITIAALTCFALLPLLFRTATGTAKTIAILPLKPIDASLRNELYEIGTADAIINRLSAIEGLRVRPLEATRAYTEVSQDPRAAGREQKVDYVVASTYQLADGFINVRSQLINVRTGDVEDSIDLKKEASKVLATQDSVASDLAARIIAKFGAKIKGPPAKRGTENEEAYRLYQQGMVLFDRQGPEFVDKAQDYMNRAVSLDPNYAHAWAGIARAVRFEVKPESRPQVYKRSLDAIKTALAIDPNLAEAYVSQCYINLIFEYDAKSAETSCKRALELDPDSADGRMTYNMVLLSHERFDEASTEIKTAMDLAPASFNIQRQYANTLAGAGRYPEAEEQYKRLIDANPTNVAPYRRLIRVLETEGRETEAFGYLLKLLPIEGRDGATIDRIKQVYAVSGWRGVVAERISLEKQKESPDYIKIGEWYGYLGNKDEAFENLERAFQKHSSLMIFARVELRHIDSIRSDPRFDALMDRVEHK